MILFLIYMFMFAITFPIFLIKSNGNWALAIFATAGAFTIGRGVCQLIETIFVATRDFIEKALRPSPPS